jgi:hypothetical protein
MEKCIAESVECHIYRKLALEQGVVCAVNEHEGK